MATVHYHKRPGHRGQLSALCTGSIAAGLLGACPMLFGSFGCSSGDDDGTKPPTVGAVDPSQAAPSGLAGMQPGSPADTPATNDMAAGPGLTPPGPTAAPTPMPTGAPPLDAPTPITPPATADPAPSDPMADAGVANPAGTGGGAAGCTRDLLSATTDAFYAALAAHAPDMLKLTDTVRYTENGEEMALGEGLWQAAGMSSYRHSALDTETCMSVTESGVPDDGTEIPVGVRLKLEGDSISEIEMIVVRPGDYTVLGRPFPSSIQGLKHAPDIGWEESVPAEQRNSREEIEAWLDKYFRSFPGGGCDLDPDCGRRENGGGNFNCMAALTCSAGEPSGRGTLVPRLFVIDEERGIGVGFTMFMGHTDFHMIKMYAGQVHEVHAILSAASDPGWS